MVWCHRKASVSARIAMRKEHEPAWKGAEEYLLQGPYTVHCSAFRTFFLRYLRGLFTHWE